MGLLDTLMGAKCQNCGTRVKTPLRSFGMLLVCDDCLPKLEEEKRARAEENERLRLEEEENQRVREEAVRREKAEADQRRRVADPHACAAGGDKEALIRLLDDGAPVDARDWNERTPLMMAAFKADAEIVQLLLERGANPNGRNKIGWTPLHFAAAAGREDVARVLLDRGAIPTNVNDDGLTPARLAENKQFTPLAELLDRA